MVICRVVKQNKLLGVITAEGDACFDTAMVWFRFVIVYCTLSFAAYSGNVTLTLRSRFATTLGVFARWSLRNNGARAR